MGENMDCYSTSEFTVKCTECGLDNKMFLNVIMGDMQEAAEKGSAGCGFGTRFLAENGICWIILRVKAHFDYYPVWGDKFSVKTWGSGFRKIVFSREFEYFDSEGKRFGYITTDWILADWNSHKPVIPSKKDFLPEIKIQDDRRVFPDGTIKIEVPDLQTLGSSEPVICKYADFSELDRNRHVNNTRYVSWACDALHKSGLDVFAIRDLDINYINEVKEGEKVSIFVQEGSLPQTYLVAGYREDGKALFSVIASLK
jgi:acyl-ACP thioesterase